MARLSEHVCGKPRAIFEYSFGALCAEDVYSGQAARVALIGPAKVFLENARVPSTCYRTRKRKEK